MKLTFKAAQVKNRIFYEVFDELEPSALPYYFTTKAEAHKHAKSFKRWVIRKVKNSATLQRWSWRNKESI